MLLRRKRMLPSPNATLHPPEWLLPMLMSLKLPPPLYLTVFMAFVTFFIDVQSSPQWQPRGHARCEPGDTSRPFHATSKSISVLLVPSEIAVILTPVVTVGKDVYAPAWCGSMPSYASPPWPPTLFHP